MKRVITYGTFDLLHYGHINLLRRAKQLGDYLIVALSTDEFNWREKQKKCYFSYEERKQLLRQDPLCGSCDSGGRLGAEAYRCEGVSCRYLCYGRRLEGEV